MGDMSEQAKMILKKANEAAAEARARELIMELRKHNEKQCTQVS